MNEYAMKKMVRQCIKMSELAKEKGFLLITLDRAVTGIGAGGAFAWMRADETWKAKLLKGISRDAVVEDAVELSGDEDFYEDEMEESWGGMDADTTAAADYRLLYFGGEADVNFFAHVNRTEDGLNIKEDFVRINRSGIQWELPIVYWNVGSIPVKADGRLIRPGYCYISSPSNRARTKRREMECQAKQWLLEQYNCQVKQVEKEIMSLRPDCPGPLVHRLAMQFFNQYI